MVRHHLKLSTYRRAQKRNSRRSLRARRADRRKTARVTRVYRKWSRAPARYDMRGIDTKRRRRRR